MGRRRFSVEADIRSKASAEAIREVLNDTFPAGSITAGKEGFLVRAELEGESARELNRELLSGLRRVERRTTLRAVWRSEGVVERFFDYTPRGTPHIEEP